jgi:hypothetical protein
MAPVLTLEESGVEAFGVRSGVGSPESGALAVGGRGFPAA